MGSWSTSSRTPRLTRCWPGCGPWAAEMWKITIRGLLAHKLRLGLTAIAIVLGVTFVSGTFVLTDTLHNTFTTLFNNVYENVDFEVRATATLSGGNGNTAAV